MRKMNSEIFPKSNNNSKIVPDNKDLEYNIVWFDGEVCTIVLKFYIIPMILFYFGLISNANTHTFFLNF